ncbi:YgjP-like metallopeptidase domain-containing protein [Catenovulum maritimum]|uniref:Metal-dependent hydrolase n=1 Tax=Catenovulum maritimum TaxID=1513271 RepID=A0A0J8GMN1_9ALTE|nr:YgjP-like metallopeptidase domain-containing protein [Catenovulum maritimum]KMT64050.1 metal-dependent hydrolase [Catenovulum maritimum]
MSQYLKYLTPYPQQLQQQVLSLFENDQLAEFLLKKYPTAHSYNNDSDLRNYVSEIKNQYLKKSSALSKICYDNKIHVVNNALGLHSYVTRIQGSKLKSKNELRISSVFKKTPEPFLNMIVVHELAHLKEKEHNKAFYRLCEHMQPNYHQLEFDMRVYLTQIEFKQGIY